MKLSNLYDFKNPKCPLTTEENIKKVENAMKERGIHVYSNERPYCSFYSESGKFFLDIYDYGSMIDSKLGDLISKYLGKKVTLYREKNKSGAPITTYKVE